MKSLRQTGALVVSDVTRIHSDAPGFKAFTTLFNAPCVLVTQSSPTLCDPMDCSSPGFSVHGILQARILEWTDIPSSRGSSPPRD